MAVRTQAQLKQIYDSHNAAASYTFKVRDFVEHGELYTEDCRILSPGHTAKIGREGKNNLATSKGWGDMCTIIIDSEVSWTPF